MLAPDGCYRALRARDRRFDGLFFVGVTTTGVYCRPICPARIPRADRCQFFPNAAAAEKAGFRACLRCRPELAPGRASVDALPRLVARAVARIDAGFLDEQSVEQLADELGVSSRHLRRALEAELGVGPLELAATRRLALAKQLLHDSALDLTTIAFASGFQSVRRFNAAFAARFGRPPSALRRSARERPRDAARPITLRLDLRPPFAWSTLLGFLRNRAIPGIEQVGEHDYQRLVAIEGHVGHMRVEHDPARPCLHVELAPTLAPVLARIVPRLRRMFDLDAEPDAIDRSLALDPLLAPLVERRPGLRVAGSFDAFEALVRTVLGQQVSLAAARTLSARLVEQLGQAHEVAPPLDRSFPSPAALVDAEIDALASIGIPRTRATLIRTIARAWSEGTLALEQGNDPGLFLERLQTLPGVGPWTLDYASLRVLHFPDAFPASDGALKRVFPDAPPRAIEQRAEAWRPFRAYGAQHLWTALVLHELP